MRIPAVIALSAALLVLTSCSSQERDILDMSDPAMWARVWLIEKAMDAKHASDSDEWRQATSFIDIVGPCDPDFYLDLPSDRDRKAFGIACADLVAVFDKEGTYPSRASESTKAEIDRILDYLGCDMGIYDCPPR